MKKRVDNIGVFIQLVLGFAIIILMLISIFTNVLYTPIQILIIPELLIMAFNTFCAQKGIDEKYKVKKAKDLSKKDVEEYKRNSVSNYKLKMFLYLALSLYIAISLIIGSL